MCVCVCVCVCVCNCPPVSGDSLVGESNRMYEGIGSNLQEECPPHTAWTGSAGGGTASASRGLV